MTERIIDFINAKFEEVTTGSCWVSEKTRNTDLKVKWNVIKDTESVKYYEEGLQFKITDVLTELA